MNNEQFQFAMTRDMTKALQKIDNLEKCFTNHLKHHWAVTLSALGALLSLLTGIAIIAIRHYWPFQ